VVDEPMVHSVSTIVSPQAMGLSEGDALDWETERLARALRDKPGVTLRRCEARSFAGKPAGLRVTLTKYPYKLAQRLLRKYPDRYRRYVSLAD
jgi:hypothetical protein